jgi:thiamine biosynthesis lipoprotein
MSAPPSIHHFTHEAMQTSFSLELHSIDAHLAREAAHAGIALIDAIESSLSRYIEGSDVWQINQMESGQSLFLTQNCYDCLRLALEAHARTGGLFDITLGRRIEHRKNSLAGPPPPLDGSLMIDPDKPAIHCLEAGREIDLGGIGKGFALDRVKALLLDWGIDCALLSAGASTRLAFGDHAWPVSLPGTAETRTVELRDQALSASGTAIQGSHIVSPRSNEHVCHHERIWVLASTATTADAWSTAALLMEPGELEAATPDDLRILTE